MSTECGSTLKSCTIRKSTIAQFTAALGCGSMYFNLGIMFLFPVIVVGSIIDTTGDILSLTKEQASWYSSIGFLVNPIGCLVGGILQNYIGRKHGMLLASIPALTTWILLYNSNTLTALYISAILMGFSMGFSTAPTRAYVSEVTEPRLRGVLSACLGVVQSLGSFFVLFLTSIVTWRVNALICASVPVLSIILLILVVPESPYWLLNKGRTEEASKALCWLRGWISKEGIETEFIDLRRHIQIQAANINPIRRPSKHFDHDIHSDLTNIQEQLAPVTTPRKDIKKILLHPSTVRPFFFIIGYGFFTVCASGHGARSYMFNIAQSAGSKTEFLAFGSGAASILGNLTCVLVIRLIGMQKLSLISMSLCSLTSILMGMCLLYKDELALPSSLPILFYVLHYSFFLGIQSISWMLMGELFPTSTRSIGIALCATVFYIYFFTFTKTYFFFANVLGTHGIFFMNGVIGLLGCLYSLFFLPETGGKSLIEIEKYFSNRSDEKNNR